MTLSIGSAVPDFSLSSDEETIVSNNSLLGNRYILYFYPKDDTPGCTTESCDFRDQIKYFQTLQVQIFGVSKDSVASHKKFREKYSLPFPLLSDDSTHMCEDFGVWQEKSMYGKTYMGITRTTFVISDKGIVEAVFENVKVPNHVTDVIKILG